MGKTDYCVPFALTQGKEAVVKIVGLPKDAVALKEMKLSDTFDTTNTDYYRPVYHHTPLYGWMNDANGLTYKDGEYHLYFQYNPYGSKWGNMHWGHSVSRDLVHWDHLDPAIARDPMGHIFSGSTIVDTRNSAGFGKNAIIAYYTSHSMRNGKQVQVQCMAYSKDNGRTFIKYKGNPVVTPFDGLENFRDPKIFWYEPTKSWYMIVSADKNMRFYQSKNLKKWTYVSQWGEGFGAQPNQFECPDFFPLAVDGDPANKKYVMIVNVNPGFVFGGSATEYFVGEFDGKEFKCDSKPTTVKWLDWGKGPLRHRHLLQPRRPHRGRAMDEQLAVCQCHSDPSVSWRQRAAARTEVVLQPWRDLCLGQCRGGGPRPAQGDQAVGQRGRGQRQPLCSAQLLRG